MLSSIQQGFEKLSIKFELITQREQILILLAGLALLTMLSYTLLLEPIFLASEKIEKNIDVNELKLEGLIAQSEALKSALQVDPDLKIKVQLDKIHEQLTEVENAFLAHIEHLVPANEMPSMLQNLLANFQGLKVISLQSIPPTPLISEEGFTDHNTSSVALYRHGVELIVEGNYSDIQAYLHKLERLDWQFYWKKFDYKVTQYPLATVDLEIFTLNTSKAFIGV